MKYPNKNFLSMISKYLLFSGNKRIFLQGISECSAIYYSNTL